MSGPGGAAQTLGVLREGLEQLQIALVVIGQQTPELRVVGAILLRFRDVHAHALAGVEVGERAGHLCLQIGEKDIERLDPADNAQRVHRGLGAVEFRL